MSQTAELINFKELVALFLAEIIRTRRTSLGRAAEIANRVVRNLPQIRNEEDALAMLTDIEQDFGEVENLKQALHFGYKDSDIKVYEKEIKDYASEVLKDSMENSTGFLQEASMPGTTIQQLCLKYPDFCEFLLSVSGKSQVFRQVSK
jgi:hypothetical protein